MFGSRDVVADVRVNPLKLNGISHFYQLGKSILVLRGVRCYNFHFYSDLSRAIYKQTV